MSTSSPVQRFEAGESATQRPPLGPPSSLDGALTKKPYPSAPPAFVLKLVLWLRKRLIGLADKLVPANVVMFERSTGVASTVLLGAVARYGIADLIETVGPMTAGELAQRTGTHADTLHRVLRGLAQMNVFELRSDGKFVNHRLSRALIGGTLLRTREWLQYSRRARDVRPLDDGPHRHGRARRRVTVSVWRDRDPVRRGRRARHAPVRAADPPPAPQRRTVRQPGRADFRARAAHRAWRQRSRDARAGQLLRTRAVGRGRVPAQEHHARLGRPALPRHPAHRAQGQCSLASGCCSSSR